MQESEFDRFADEYRDMHVKNLRLSGENPEYFTEYKIALLARKSESMHKGISSAPVRFLDFGAGVGSSIPFIRKYFPQADIHSLDVSKRSLAVGESRFPGQATFTVFDGSRVPYDPDSFEFVFAACVFHHIDPQLHVQVLTELRRVLKPGGVLIVFEHNPYNPLTVHAVNTCPFDENAVLLRPSELRRSFELADLTAIRNGFTVFFPRAFRALRRSEPALEWLPLGAQYYVHATKP